MSVGAWGPKLYERRQGIMLHYDGSASDAGAIAWLTKDPRCRVSYNWIVMDDGRTVLITLNRAWHAGKCRPSESAPGYRDANSAFYGIAVAARAGEQVTEAQENAVIDLCVSLFDKHQWPKSEVFRIVGHNTECFPAGRKVDPEGVNPDKPVLSVEAVRNAVHA